MYQGNQGVSNGIGGVYINNTSAVVEGNFGCIVCLGSRYTQEEDITQLVDKKQTVIVNGSHGTITTAASELKARHTVGFMVSNNTVRPGDMINIQPAEPSKYKVTPSLVTDGAFDITLENLSETDLSEPVDIIYQITYKHVLEGTTKFATLETTDVGLNGAAPGNLNDAEFATGTHLYGHFPRIQLTTGECIAYHI